MPSTALKLRTEVPQEVLDLFKKMKIETEEARRALRRAQSLNARHRGYQVVTWLSNNSDSLVSEEQNAKLEVPA